MPMFRLNLNDFSMVRVRCTPPPHDYAKSFHLKKACMLTIYEQRRINGRRERGNFSHMPYITRNNKSIETAK